MKRWVSPVLFLLLILGFLAFRYYQSRSHVLVLSTPTTTTTAPSAPGQTGGSTANRIPSYALDVLNFVRRNGEAPEGYVGGREFQNKEGHLPKKDPQGHVLHYSEWDVHPKVQGQNRGPERLVTGSDHSAWYTGNHYRTFQKIE